jgi:hypothetical protein
MADPPRFLNPPAGGMVVGWSFPFSAVSEQSAWGKRNFAIRECCCVFQLATEH